MYALRLLKPKLPKNHPSKKAKLFYSPPTHPAPEIALSQKFPSLRPLWWSPTATARCRQCGGRAHDEKVHFAAFLSPHMRPTFDTCIRHVSDNCNSPTGRFLPMQLAAPQGGFETTLNGAEPQLVLQDDIGILTFLHAESE